MFDIDFFLFFIMRERKLKLEKRDVWVAEPPHPTPALLFLLLLGWIYTRSAAAIYMCFKGRGCEADENVRKFAKKNFPEMLGMSRDFCAVANTIIFLLLKLSTSPVLGREEVGAVWQQFNIQNTPHTSYTGEKAGGRRILGERREKFIKT